MDTKSAQFYVAIVAVVGILIAGYFYFKNIQKEEKLPDPEKASTPAVSGTLPELNTETNVLENVPEINPVDKTNPFKDVYKNPFQ